MRTLSAFVFFVSAFCLQVQAALVIRAVDNLGNRLIYDTDRNITWYDFTYQTTYRTDENPNGGWVEAGQWAAALTVYLPGVTYLAGWRLPSAGADPRAAITKRPRKWGTSTTLSWATAPIQIRVGDCKIEGFSST